MELPEGLELWTADEVAECLKISNTLYSRLWCILSDARHPTPQGGDGTNGTVETPDGRLSEDNDDKALHWWQLLSGTEQQEIATAFHNR